MENQISLAMAGGVKVLNPTPVDPRMRVAALSDIINDPTYYIGFSPIYDVSTDTTYYVSGGAYTTGWEFELLGSGAAEPDKHFEYDQGVATTFWEIEHNLNKKPSVIVIDSAGSEVFGEVEYTDPNNLTITFSAGFKGTAILN